MRKLLFFLLLFISIGFHRAYAQLIVSENNNATLLAQKLVGNGVIVTNAVFTGGAHAAGFFNNVSGTNLNLDSGIVLCTGRVKTPPGVVWGIDGNGVTPAELCSPEIVYDIPGDPDLSAATGLATGDAAKLEFDIIPLGDSINFRYVFGSDEYNGGLVCYYFDGFGFFISGPGITGVENLALVPNTNLAVSNVTINGAPNYDGTTCYSYQQYYVDNHLNPYLTYDGHTVVLNASRRVQPCQTYHLKLVIADLDNDNGVDSGVFLEAQSLQSNPASLINNIPVDLATNTHYLVEGCTNGTIKVKRPFATPSAQTVNLSFSGTAVNGTDIQALPASVTIPANQTEVVLNVNSIVDNLPEGIETIKIKIYSPSCIGGPQPYLDSTSIEIRDYDTLAMNPSHANICRNSNVQLNASAGYTSYVWDANATLSSTNLVNPVATPVATSTTYYCTASIGNCHARDSVSVRWKDIEFLSKKDINCKNGTTGQIKIAAGPEWITPLQLSINNAAWQTDSTFNNLSTGTYTIRVRDAAGCIDSITVSLLQAYPDLAASATPGNATCSGNPDGSIAVTASGGLAPYQYSINNGVNFQTSASFNVMQGNYNVLIKDFNGCTFSTTTAVGLTNDLNLAVSDPSVTICEGTGTNIQALSNASSYAWTPASGLNSTTNAVVTASPTTTTKYYVTATKGICTKKDSVLVNVNPAPVADAGSNASVCFGGNIVLNGSGGTYFTWSPPDYLSDIHSAQPTVTRPQHDITYSLNVKDADGCSSLSPATVRITVTPPIVLFVPVDTIAAIYQPLQLYAVDINNSGISSYTWAPPYGLNNTHVANPVTTLDKDMIYTVTGTTPSGCEGSAQVKVKVFEGPEIYVPSAFTPNADGKNDILRPKPVGIKTPVYFRVYNRWGQLMFSSSNFDGGWDGTLQGILQTPGSYVWIAQGIDYKGKVVTRKGSSILIK